MEPLLKAGEEVLVDPRAYRNRAPRLDELIVAQHPGQSELRIIKRIAKLLSKGDYELQGDNPDPTQSSPALVPPALIIGRVTSRFG